MVHIDFLFNLTYGSWTVNRMDSLYQTVNGLVGNVDWGESLTVIACEFPGLNTLFIFLHQVRVCDFIPEFRGKIQ